MTVALPFAHALARVRASCYASVPRSPA
jgi:hypothetical protein